MTDETTEGQLSPTVYQALNDAIASLGYVGKDGTNTNQNFSFRSIDGVVGAIRPALQEHCLSFIPSFDSSEQTDYVKADGRIQHRAVLTCFFTIIGPAGDSFNFTTIGEAMDTEGRASNKAMSAGTKNALLRLFQIGSGSDDGDGSDVPFVPTTRGPQDAPGAPQMSSLGDRVAATAQSDTGEFLTVPQGKNLYRLWHHVLGWTKDEWLQQIEIETGTRISDDRKLTRSQASDLIVALKTRAGEPVEDNRQAQGTPIPNEEPLGGYEEF